MNHDPANPPLQRANSTLALLLASTLALAGAAGAQGAAEERDAARADEATQKAQRPEADARRGLERGDGEGRPGRGDGDRGSREGRFGWPEPDPEDLTDEQIETAMEVLHAQNPHMAERLEALRESDPERFRGSIARLWSRLRHMIFLKQVDPELFELRAAEQRLTYRAVDLARRLGRAEPESPDAQRLSEELREVVEAGFEARQQVLEYELARFEERIERLRDKLYDERVNRERIIEQQYRELLEEREKKRGRHRGD